MRTAVIFNGNRSASATVVGLESGWYDVYVYCWSGQSTPRYTFANPGILMEFSNTLEPFLPGAVGSWPGGQVEGITYVKARGYIDNFVRVNYNIPTNQSAAISGIQIVPVPAPGAGLTMLAAAGALGSVRRRR